MSKSFHQGLADSVFQETIQSQPSGQDVTAMTMPTATISTASPEVRNRLGLNPGQRVIDVPGDGDQDAFLAAMTQKMKAFLRDAAVTASRPAHVDPNYWSTPLDISGSISVPNVVQLPFVYTTVVSYKVPAGSLARVQGYGLNVQDATYTYNGSLLWRIQVDGNSVANLNGFAQQRGSLVLPRQTYFLVKQDQTITFQVRRDALWTGAQVVECGLFGWIWQPRNAYDNARNARVF
jgi:hypothetical protein